LVFEPLSTSGVVASQGFGPRNFSVKGLEPIEECKRCAFRFPVADHIETLTPSVKRNPAAAIMLALLAEMARVEKHVEGSF
jgi:hypothetical protein